MLKSLARMYDAIRQARKEYTIDMTAEVSEQTTTSAIVTVRTEIRLTPAQAEELGAFASFVQMSNERVYKMRCEGGRWYVRFDDGMHSLVPRTRAQIEEFEGRARLDRPAPEDTEELQRFKRVGYRDKNSRTVIAPRFADGSSLNEGLAAVQIDKLWGFIDASGRMVIEPRFAETCDFSEGLAAVEFEDLWGFIDTSGSLVIPHRFSSASQFSDGRAEVTLPDGQEVHIDRSGTRIADARPLPTPPSP